MATALAASVTDQIVWRVRAEYLEMPGLCLTPAQARRLWNLDSDLCQAILNVLVEARFLARTRSGAFVRADNSLPAGTAT